MSTRTRLGIEQCRDAGLAATLILLLIAYIGERQAFVLPAIITLIAALLVPRLFRPWAIIWLGLARALATVGSRVLLTATYFVLVLPIGLIRRAMGADPMNTRRRRPADSAFVERDAAFQPEDFEVPY